MEAPNHKATNCAMNVWDLIEVFIVSQNAVNLRYRINTGKKTSSHLTSNNG